MNTTHATGDLQCEAPGVISPLDSLADLVRVTRMNTLELSNALGASLGSIEAWIDGKRRPSARNRAALKALISGLRQRHQQRRGGFSPQRDQAFGLLLVALHTPAERRAWIARRAQMRRQFAR